jgi:hypothetical protein
MNAPQPFTHAPRPPVIPKERESSRQRRYGRSDFVSYMGIGAASTGLVSVFRFASDEVAEIIIRTYHDQCIVKTALPPRDLRELARCLIDAAADIEAEQEAKSAGSTA